MKAINKCSVWANMLVTIIGIGIVSCSKVDGNGEDPYFYDRPSVSGKLGLHDYVDMGTSVYWAVSNIGAYRPEDFGAYYSWGETKEKSFYGDDDYAYNLIFIGNDISGTKYDVVKEKWGDSWHIPTIYDYIELDRTCESEIVDYNGVKGAMYTAPNGNKLFFPLAGLKCDSDYSFTGQNGYYWSSTFGEKGKWGYTANYWNIDPDFCGLDQDDYCSTGMTIRAVYGISKTSYNSGGGSSGGGGSSSGDAPYVTGFDYTATKTSIKVSFSVDSRPTSASVYYGESSANKSAGAPTIVGKTVTATVNGLKSGTKYYFKCTVKNSNGSSTSDNWPAMTLY